MLRIAVGGLNKNEMEAAILSAGGDKVSVLVSSDMEAAKLIKKGEIDYYFGACNSGGGAAISILIGILGYSSCCTVAMAGKKPNEEAMKKFVSEDKKAYGMSVEFINAAAPTLTRLLLEKHHLV